MSNAGISVAKGKGRYRDTHIVTFAPRYLLDNSSTHKLAFAQREFARGKVRRRHLPCGKLLAAASLACLVFLLDVVVTGEQT